MFSKLFTKITLGKRNQWRVLLFWLVSNIRYFWKEENLVHIDEHSEGNWIYSWRIHATVNGHVRGSFEKSHELFGRYASNHRIDCDFFTSNLLPLTKTRISIVTDTDLTSYFLVKSFDSIHKTEHNYQYYTPRTTQIECKITA